MDVIKIATRLNVEPAAVLYAWGVQRGYSVLTKSVTPARIESNFKQIELSQADFEAISDIAKKEGATRFMTPIEVKPKWDVDVFGQEIEKSAKFKINTADVAA